MKIGILQCGRAPDELKEDHGDYNTMFVRLLGPEFDYVHYAILDNDIPTDIHEADGWLITGSRFGVYEDHPWIKPLENFIRDVYAASVPIIGVCFGHQILAQALGGRVEKYADGWSVGQVTYNMKDGSEPLRVNAFHQDQVIEPPTDAKTIASTDFCEHAYLVYGDKAISMQPHPEFTDKFTEFLLATRGPKVLPPEIMEQGLQSLTEEISQDRIAQTFRDFYERNALAAKNTQASNSNIEASNSGSNL